MNDKQEPVALLPCPFCGDVARRSETLAGELYAISCENTACRVNPMTDNFDVPADAIAAWNTRAGARDGR